MKKTLSLILALMMMLSCFGAFAEGESSGESGGDTMSAADVINMANSSANSEAAAAEKAYLESDCAFSVIPADETTGQIELSYMAETTTILDVDGLKFKDLNKNGSLDVYEDWRKTTAERVADILAQMTPEEKIGGLLTYNVDLAQAAADIKEYHITAGNTLNTLNLCRLSTLNLYLTLALGTTTRYHHK